MQSIMLKCIFLFTFSPHMFKHISRNSKPKLKRFNRFVKTPQKSCKKKHGTKNHVLSSQHSPPSTKTTQSFLTGVDMICGISGAVLRLRQFRVIFLMHRRHVFRIVLDSLRLQLSEAPLPALHSH